MELAARKKAVADALQGWRESDAKITMPIQFKGEALQIPVITLSPSVPLLNHDNYRFAAQLEDLADRDQVLANPLTKASQDALAAMLAKTEDFKKLKAQLSELGQRENGLITREGLLVNGNTRTVALRELGAAGMRVGVLPEGTTSEDVLNLQVELQMLHLVKQDYTFTNELILLGKLSAYPGADLDGVSRKLGWPVGPASRRKLEQKARILELIREIRAMHTGEPLPYSIFDEKQELLENLDTAYQKLKATDFNSAETLKWSRIAGMLAGLTKDQVRVIDGSFIQDHVKPRVAGNPLIDVPASTTSGIFGGASSAATMAKALASEVVNAKFDESGKEINLGPGAVQDVALGMQVAAEARINENRLNQMLTDPVKHLRESRLKFDDIFAKFGNIAGDRNFDLEEFEDELGKVSDAIKRLAKSIDDLRN